MSPKALKNILKGLGVAYGMDTFIGNKGEGWTKTRAANFLVNTALGGRINPNNAAEVMGGIIVKDMALNLLPTAAKAPGWLERTVKAQEDRAQALKDVTKATKHQTRTNQLIGATATGGGLLAAAWLADAIRKHKSTIVAKPEEEEGRVHLTLPTRDPNDAETTIDLPISQIRLPKTISSGLRRDVKRRLRAETLERVKHRDQPVLLEEPKMASGTVNQFNRVLGRPNAPIPAIQFENKLQPQNEQQEPPPPTPPPTETKVQIAPVKLSPALKGMLKSVQQSASKANTGASKRAFIDNPNAWYLGQNSQAGQVGVGSSATYYDNDLVGRTAAKNKAKAYGLYYDANAGSDLKAPETKGEAIGYNAKRLGRTVREFGTTYAANIVDPIYRAHENNELANARISNSFKHLKEDSIWDWKSMKRDWKNIGHAIGNKFKTVGQTAAVPLDSGLNFYGWSGITDGLKPQMQDYNSVRDSNLFSATRQNMTKPRVTWLAPSIQTPGA